VEHPDFATKVGICSRLAKRKLSFCSTTAPFDVSIYAKKLNALERGWNYILPYGAI